MLATSTVVPLFERRRRRLTLSVLKLARFPECMGAFRTVLDAGNAVNLNVREGPEPFSAFRTDAAEATKQPRGQPPPD